MSACTVRSTIMALPSFLLARRQKKSPPSSTSPTSPSDAALPSRHPPSKTGIKHATRTRLFFALLTSFCFLVSLVFLILVEVGNTSSRKVVGSIWFLKLDFANIIPQSVPDAVLVNSIAQTLGLHDFYQVGLWNFCEGNDGQISSCSTPRTLYWFNPVQIIINELLSGATSTDSHCPIPRRETLKLKLSSRPPLQHHHLARPRTHRLPLDVRSVLDFRSALLPLHAPHPSQHLLPPAHPPHCLPLLPMRLDHHRRLRHRHCALHHLPQRHHLTGLQHKYRSRGRGQDVRFYVDGGGGRDCRMLGADGVVLLLCESKGC